MNEVGAEWDVNRRDTASHEIDGMNETRSGEMNDVWLASLRFTLHPSLPFSLRSAREPGRGKGRAMRDESRPFPRPFLISSLILRPAFTHSVPSLRPPDVTR